MVVGPVRCLFADEISTGLDSNTTYTIMRSLRNFAHVLRATVVVGLLQPQPETFDLFDACILLSNGKARRCAAGLGAAARQPGAAVWWLRLTPFPPSSPLALPPGLLPRAHQRGAALLSRPGLRLPAPPRRGRLPAGKHWQRRGVRWLAACCREDGQATYMGGGQEGHLPARCPLHTRVPPPQEVTTPSDQHVSLPGIRASCRRH
jgi:hypothetical protein